MTSDTTPLAQRLRESARRIDSEALIAARPGQTDRLEEIAADLSGMALQLDEIALANREAVATTRHGLDLFAALLRSYGGIWVVTREDLARVHGKQQVDVRNHPEGYELSLCERGAET